MKHHLSLILLLALTCTGHAAEPNQKPFTVPEIMKWKGAKGQLPVSQLQRVLYADGEYVVASEYLARHLNPGQQLGVSQGSKAQKGAVLITRKGTKVLGREAYQIEIDKKGVTLRVNSAQGAVWGVQTLLQMAQTGNGELPLGVVTDAPDYEVRGFMIDCGRKYIPMDYLRNLVKVMSYYKMNTLCVHLNDNGFKKYFHNNWDETYAAFRMESDYFPGLTAKDGSYTKDEFRAFCKESERMGVEIIPEIDVPAHSLAFTHYRPSLGCEEFGVDHFDLTNPQVVPFIDSLFTEYIVGPDPVFAGRRVHIGTDEYSNKKQEVVELFRSLTDHLIRLCESHGKQAVAWGSLTYAKGETPVKVDNVIMAMWNNGFANPNEMKQLGYKMINIPDGWAYIVPRAGYYYDYLYDQMLYEKWTPANVNGIQMKEKDPNILGGMFAVWNDVCGNGISIGDIHHRVHPAMQVMSHKCWHAVNDTVGYQQWNEQRRRLYDGPEADELGRAEIHVVEVKPETRLAATEQQIGYDYQVDFDITWGREERGAILTQSHRAEFYLCDPIRGMMGYSRDGYLFTFNYKGTPGRSEHITIKGTNRATQLLVNGRLIQELGTDVKIAADLKPYDTVQTLVFPLTRTGKFKSEVRHLKSRKL